MKKFNTPVKLSLAQMIVLGAFAIITLGIIRLPFHTIPEVNAAFDPSRLDAAVSQTIYVDPSNPAASDTNNGSASRPVRTITRGVILAASNANQSIGTRVLVSPGTYRELVRLDGGLGGTNYPIVLESAVPGQAIISGSDVWSTGWTQQGSGAVYTHNWPYDWGLAPIPGGWSGVTVPEHIRHREIIFVNGTPLRQVYSTAQLTPGTFIVNESSNVLTVSLSSTAPISSQLIEVGVRSLIFQVNGRNNVVVRGFVFQHANTAFDTGSQIYRSQNVLMENNTFRWNNDCGFGISRSYDIVTRNNTYSDNGGIGFGASRVVNLLVENDTAFGNNWRGYQANYIEWSVAGIKHLMIHNGIYRGLNVHDNYAHGLWFDTDNINIQVEQSSIINNYNSGLYLENSQGPFRLDGLTIAHNDDMGIQAANIENVTLQNSIFYGNGVGQIYFTGADNGRTHQNWETGEQMTLQPTENWTMTNNVLVGRTSSEPVLKNSYPDAPWQIFASTLTSNNNTYYNAQTQSAFGLGYRPNGTLAAWQQATGEDLNSVFGVVQFRDPNNNDFTIISRPPLPGGSGATNTPNATATRTPTVTATATRTPTATTIPTTPVAVSSFTLINADTDEDLHTMTSGETINLAALGTRNLNIRINTNPGQVGSIRLQLNGSDRTENLLPYSLWGDQPGNDYNPWTPSAGAYTLSATPYSDRNLAGTAGTAMTVTFTVVDQPATTPTNTPLPSATPTRTPTSSTSNPAVVSFTLINATTDQDIRTLVNGDTLNLATLPSRNLNIRANTSGTVSRVVFNLNGTTRTETLAPWAFWGNSGNNYSNWTPAVGSYTLTGTASGSGSATGSRTISFTVTNQATTTANQSVSVMEVAPQPTSVSNSSLSVTSFILVDATTDRDIRPLVNGETLNLAVLSTRNLNIRVATAGSVGSVRMGMNGSYRTENGAPYALMSDNAGDFFNWTPSAGSYSLSAVAYSRTNMGGSSSQTASIQFTVVNTPITQHTVTVNVVGSGSVTRSPNQAQYTAGTTIQLAAVAQSGWRFSGWSGGVTGSNSAASVTVNSNLTITATFVQASPTATARPAPTSTPRPAAPIVSSIASFTLINADTDQDIRSLINGDTLNLATLPSRNLNIRINTSPNQVGSILVSLNGSARTENALPYSLWGDEPGNNYNAWTPMPGIYTVTASTYSGANLSGTASLPFTVTFTVVDNSPINYTLATNVVGGGVVTLSPNQAQYAPGTAVQLVAVAQPGWQFAGWSNGLTGMTNPATITLSSNVNVTATFVQAVAVVPTNTPDPVATEPTPTLQPVALPIIETMDDGSTDWEAAGSWTLTAAASYSGMGWQIGAAPEQGTLVWETPIDLTVAQYPHLTFQSNLVTSGYTANVEISLDRLTWLPLLVVQPVSGWIEVNIDLSAYRGQIVNLRWMWLPPVPQPAQSVDSWVIDQVAVVEQPPAPTETPVPTATETPVPTATETPLPTATETPVPTAIPVAQRLVLTSVCAGTWTVNNPNAAQITYSWELSGSGIRSTPLIALPGDNILLTGAATGQPETIFIYYDLGDGQGELFETNASNTQTCP